MIATLWAYRRPLAVLAAAAAIAVMSFNAGRDSVQAAVDKAQAAAREQARIEYENKTRKALENAEADRLDSEARLRQEFEGAVRTEQVIKYVTKTIYVPAACTGLAADVVRVLHDTTDTIRRAAAPGDTGGPADTMLATARN